MKTINKGFRKLGRDYIFDEIGKKAEEKENRGEELIRVSTGDAVFPLGKTVTEALVSAAAETGTDEGFRGYPPVSGYGFLKCAIRRKYLGLRVEVKENEIYVGNGTKSDISGFFDLFDSASVIVPDPGYPVYGDSCAISGLKAELLKGSFENGFLPAPCDLKTPVRKAVIILCSPANPTGEAYPEEVLRSWVLFAIRTRSVILFDAAYEAYIKDSTIPRSIYAVEGASLCAVEFGSFSKSAGFTGLRCSYTIIPENLRFGGENLGKLWARRQSSKFNGVPYIVQKAAEAALSPEGRKESEAVVGIYGNNAFELRKAFLNRGIRCCGGVNSPYVWVACPKNATSARTADDLLNRAGVVVTPGTGFGKNGEGFIRLSGFLKPEKLPELLGRLNSFYDRSCGFIGEDL